jgi:hypothetical protein
VVIVFVADHDGIQVWQLFRTEGDWLAWVVEGLLREPRVREYRQSPDLNEVTAVGDACDGE